MIDLSRMSKNYQVNKQYYYLYGALKKKGIALDRKSLSDMAEHKPETFERLIKQISKKIS